MKVKYDPTYGLSFEEMSEATAIAQDVVANGRVTTDEDGNFNYLSYVGEISFEAGERGYDPDTANRMAQYSADDNDSVNAER